MGVTTGGYCLIVSEAPPSLVDVTAVVRRVVAARVRDRHLVEDLTQETLTRVAAVTDRLEPDATRAYAIVTARNLIATHARRAATHARLQHRLVDYRQLDGPELLTLEREETDALAVALSRLDADERALLVRHEANGEPVNALADDLETSAGAIKMRLARARAALRVEFVLASRRVALPTQHCRHVLMALSSGDIRRQRRLGASTHLLSCPTCADIAPPVTERNRSIAGWLIAPLAAALQRVASKVDVSPRTAVTAALATAVVTVGAVIAINHDPASAPPTAEAAPSILLDGMPPAPASAPASVAAASTCPPPAPLETSNPAVLLGCSFAPTVITPTDIAADEGFWAATATDQIIWVALIGSGESPFDIVAGQPVQIVGTIVAAPDDPAQIDAPDDAQSRLTQAGYFINVNFDDLSTL